jgi:hypothetical protein
MRVTSLPAIRSCIVIGLSALLLGGAPKADAQAPVAPPVDTIPRKDPRTARVRAILPGAGHWYAGEKWRAALVPTGVLLIMVEGSVRNEESVPCYYDIPPEENCVTGSPDAISYAALAGWLALSIWDAGRAAERTNARRRGMSLVVQARSGRAHAGYRVGLRVPVGGP